MPSFFASSNSGCVSFDGMLFSKNFASTSAWSSIHQRGKNVVKASSGKTTNFAPIACASRRRLTSRLVAAARVSARLSGPSCAAAPAALVGLHHLHQELDEKLDARARLAGDHREFDAAEVAQLALGAFLHPAVDVRGAV